MKKKTDHYFIQRFWSLVDLGPDCWTWKGAVNSDGYGVFEARLKGQQHYRAHRFSWALENGHIPEDELACHSCDNRLCVNPSHLWLGDVSDNQRDKFEKGRHRYGERHNMAVLTDEDVLVIRECEGTHEEIARRYGVHGTTIANIRNGKRWRHLLPRPR